MKASNIHIKEVYFYDFRSKLPYLVKESNQNAYQISWIDLFSVNIFFSCEIKFYVNLIANSSKRTKK